MRLFGEAGKEAEQVEKMKEQARAAELKYLETLKKKVQTAREQGNRAEAEKFGKLLARQAPNVANQIGIQIDPTTGKVSTETKGKSKTQVETSFAPELDG